MTNLNHSPLTSVVIPCYNQGPFIEDAVASVLKQTIDNFEIIVVDDGSTDPYTKKLFGNYQKSKITMIRTRNQGLAAARNTGIAAAKGKYILPLDADDAIAPAYLEKAVEVLEENPQVGIVYCKAELFGAETGPWDLPDYSFDKMLVDNLIFCSGVFRKNDWSAVGGYDPVMHYGWEDYDFWLSLIEKGREVRRLPETLFYYRVKEDGMLRSATREQKIETYTWIFKKHEVLFKDNIHVWIDKLQELGELHRRTRRYEKELEIIKSSFIWRAAEQLRKLVYGNFPGLIRLKMIFGKLLKMSNHRNIKQE